MVGGWSFNRSKFNRAMQAYRQLGSTFKPIVYTAAIDRGLTPATLIVDQPVSYPAGSGGLYEPQNYDHKFEGPVTLRRALEQSRNIPAIKMMEEVGPPTVVSYAKRFGFSREFPPYLPIALGAGEGTLLEVTSAYTVFPNRGVRARPYFIQSVTDRQGNLLEEGRIDPVNVIRADTAFMMTSLLQGVVRRGTAEAASSIEWPLAGKTGTVDENTDAWFIGFDPDITVGVWTGLDAKKSIGANETGAVAALPIWMDFMKAYVAARSEAANLRRTRRTSCFCRWIAPRARWCPATRRGPSPRRSSPAPSQAGSTSSRNRVLTRSRLKPDTTFAEPIRAARASDRAPAG